MRSRDEVLERFREMHDRKLHELKARMLGRVPCNCVHNVRLSVKNVGKVGLCQNPKLLVRRGKPLVCNDDEFAGRCSQFTCLYSESDVETHFEAILKSPARCGEEYPKLAMLIWFLQGEGDTLSRGKRLMKHLKTVISEGRKVLTLTWLR